MSIINWLKLDNLQTEPATWSLTLFSVACFFSGNVSKEQHKTK